MKTTYKPYLIECITNLHVGSSGTNYGIVDNLVQRDPVTKFPTINASSLKGALKKHFEKKWDEENIALIPTIFGEEGKGSTQGTIGTYNFLGADLLALPVRSNYMSYALAISLTNSKIINNKATLFFNDTKTLIEPAILGFNEDKFFENTSLP